MLETTGPQLADGTPYFGRLGEVAYDPDEDRVQCHLCGEWFVQVGGSHLARKHGWTMYAYRDAFQLPKRVSTCAPGLSQQRRDHTVQRLSLGGDLAANAGRFKNDRDSAAAGARTATSRRRSSGVRRVFYSKNPTLKTEWHPTRNQGISPDVLGMASKQVVWWQCGDCGHEWQASITSRAQSGTGCPRCWRAQVGRQAQAVNAAHVRERAPHRALAVVRPDLVGELHPTRNEGLDASVLLAGSRKRVWWRCPRGHEWEAVVNNRSRGTGCPFCAGRRKPAG